MRAHCFLSSVLRGLTAAIAVAALLLCPAAVVQASSSDLSRSDVRMPTEKQRLQAHFLQVEAELRRRDVSRLSAAQRAARQRLIAWVGEYRVRGVFPRNAQVSGRRVPIFRDNYRTLCAMAYLIDRSGRADIVDKVAATRNLAYIPELADDPELVTWLHENGLMLDEAARIQPAYGFLETPERQAARREINRYTSRTNTALTLNTLSIGVNAIALSKPAHRQAFGGVGVLTGLYGLVLGLNEPDRDRTRTGLAARWNFMMGGVSLALGIYNLTRAQPRDGAEGAGDTAALKSQPLKRETRVGFAPLFGGTDGAGGYLTVNARF